jgi:hypothetical protein
MTVTAEEFSFAGDRMTNDKGNLTQLLRAQGPALPTPAIFRIRVVRDPYEMQSYATAEIMADDRTWTHLISIPPTKWHKDARTEAAYRRVARDLRVRINSIFAL